MLLTMPQRGADSSTFPGVTNKSFSQYTPELVHFPEFKIGNDVAQVGSYRLQDGQFFPNGGSKS
jgi:hypothetical protein